MKNIHILPTDKPSILYKRNDLNTFHLGDFDICDPNDYSRTNQNIYITSDEEIKGETFAINLKFNCVQKVNPPKDVDYDIFNKCFKKIILTTDQDLIKDGVQSIDDEFLEWFVKNPSCESVEVYREKPIGYTDNIHITFWGLWKIIIPKEEPKQEHNKFLSCCRSKEECHCEKELKQETLEEVIKQELENHFFSNVSEIKQAEYFIRFGAKWQQEQNNNKKQ